LEIEVKVKPVNDREEIAVVATTVPSLVLTIDIPVGATAKMALPVNVTLVEVPEAPLTAPSMQCGGVGSGDPLTAMIGQALVIVPATGGVETPIQSPAFGVACGGPGEAVP
jgi:hypothetical protein